PCVRPIVDQHLASRKFARYRFPVWNIDDHDAAPQPGIAAGSYTKTGLVSKGDEALRLPQGLCADRLHADLVDDLIARSRGIQRGNVGSAVQEPECIVSELDRAGLEFKRMPVSHPPGRRRPQVRPQIRTYVQVSGAWAATQPFNRAAGREIHAERANIDW